MHTHKLCREATSTIDTRVLVPDDMRVIITHMGKLAILDIEDELGTGLELVICKEISLLGVCFVSSREGLSTRDKASITEVDKQHTHAERPASVVCVIEARHGGSRENIGSS